MTSLYAGRDSYPHQNDLTWSRSEKTIARAVFDTAVKQELQEVRRETKRMADQISDPANLQDLEHYPSQRREDIRNDYRCS